MSIGERLKYLIDNKGLTAYIVADDTGISQSTLSRIINKNSKPNASNLKALVEYFKIDKEWFLTGNENNYTQNETINHFAEPESDYKKNQKKENKGVPYYDVEFTAGFLEVENNNSIMPDSYVSHPFFKGCDYVVRASGQSMAKVICHGDAIGLVKINNWKEFFPFGEIYAIVTNDGFRMVKVITKGDTDDHYTLISKPTDNKKDEFPNQQIKKSSIMSIFKVQASSHLY